MDHVLKRAGGGGSKEPARAYHPPPSVGHEMGVMFGFIGASRVSFFFFFPPLPQVTIALYFG